MSRSEDVSTLFRRFGGDASTYQEVVADQQVGAAMAKWPMLDQIRPHIRPSAPIGALANMVGQTRVRQVIPDAVHPQPAAFEPIAPAPVSVSVAQPAVVAVAPQITPMSTPAPEPAAQPGRPPRSPVVQTFTPPAPPSTPMPVAAAKWSGLSTPAVTPPPPRATPAAGSPGLKSLFERMVPKKPTASPLPAGGSSVKGLAKW